ncbi:MAG TPA: ATP-binding protein [Thermoanaerobaculia bacterium]|nr:ATP-binding protein [Thermoanaerobaculia bacterium]
MKLSSRFSLLFGILALGVAVLLVLFWDALLDRASRERAIRRLQAEDTLLAALAEPVFGDPAAVDRLVRSAGDELGARVTAIDATGRVISDSQVDPRDVPRMENHLHRPEVLEAAGAGAGSSRRFSATLDRNFVYLAERIPKSGVIRGYLRVAFPIDELAAQESETLWAGRAAIAASCLALFLVGHVASRRFAAPLRRVTDATLAVARGDLKRDPPDEDDPDAAALSDAVRRMKNSLLASLAAAESERRLTAAVFDRLPSGLVVVDGKREILQANAAFSRMLDVLDPAGRPLVDIVREPAVIALVDRALAAKAEQSIVWKRPGDTTWEVSVLPLEKSTRGRAVAIFRDVTPLARTESMRRRFVADVSHELRTPISSIAAAAETLSESAPDREESTQLTALIARQATRMRDLIEDLTDLSRIESGAIELSPERVPLLPLVREVADDLAPRAAARAVTIDVDGDDELAVSGDRRRLLQIVFNLLDNAVKFSPDGERVDASVSGEDGRVVLRIEDRGPGVPLSEREKIFQRFYQVDPSRSKAKPGTGLGLAIVKHLAVLHDATVSVGGEAGRGASFRVSFPAFDARRS